MKKLIYTTLFCILCISASAQSLSEARTLMTTNRTQGFDIDMMGMYIDIEMHLTDTEHVSGFAMNQYPFTARKVK